MKNTPAKKSSQLDTSRALQTREGIPSLIERFLRAQSVTESSRDTYRRQIKQFARWVESNGIRDIERDDILDYKEHLRGRKFSALSIAGYITVVRKFFEWAESVKLYPNIAKGIKGAKRVKGFRKDPLSIEQIRYLLNNIDRSTLQGLRDYALINLLVRTGLRTIEVIRANIGDIRQDGGEAVLWIQGKGREEKDEFVLLTPDTLKPINEYIKARKKVGTEAPLFTSMSDRNYGQRLSTKSVRRIVKDNLKDIGLDNGRLTAHSLRHTAITLSLLGGATLQEAQTLGRHADINTTLIYSHNIDRVKNAPEKRIDALLSDRL